jgi:ligand-binding SRPBCC domain-containing protein
LIEVSTTLPAPAAEVWARAASEEGINDELRPVLRMTMSPPLRGKTIEDVPTGERLGRSWILLGGVLPVDYDDLCLVEVEPGRRFQERSSMAALRIWTHERVVEPAGDGGCTVTDRLGWEPRAALAWVPGADRIIARIVGALFRHRHRRLARYWASPAA